VVLAGEPEELLYGLVGSDRAGVHTARGVGGVTPLRGWRLAARFPMAYAMGYFLLRHCVSPSHGGREIVAHGVSRRREPWDSRREASSPGSGRDVRGGDGGEDRDSEDGEEVMVVGIGT
jgi:hypothetical protein